MSDRIRNPDDVPEPEARRSQADQPMEEQRSSITPSEREHEARTTRSDSADVHESQPEDEPEDIRRWRQRMDQANREKWEAKRELEQLRRQVMDWQRQQSPQASNDEERGYLRRKEEEKVERFTEACNRTFQAGKDEYPDFDDAVSNLSRVGASQSGEKWRDFLDAVATVSNGHRAYYELAKDPDEAARVMNMSPVGMATKLLELSRGRDAGAQAFNNRSNALSSRAPPPIRPIGGRATPPPADLERVPMRDFIRTRNRQEEERRRGDI